MFERPEALDKPFDDITKEEWKKISRWRTIKNIYPFALFLFAATSGMFLSRLIPLTWGKVARVVTWVLIALFVIWIVDIVRSNIKYARRKKRQARKIMEEPNKIIHQLQS